MTQLRHNHAVCQNCGERLPGQQRFDYVTRGDLPRRIMPMDVDLILHDGGPTGGDADRFLVIEHKRPDERAISPGQWIALSALNRQPNVDVLKVEGYQPDDIRRFGPWKGPHSLWDDGLEAGDADALRKFLASWFAV